MSKYIFLALELSDGEQQYVVKTVREVPDGETIDGVSNDYLKNFWGDSRPYPIAPERCVEYPNGVVGEIERCYEITKEHHDILKQYI